MFFVSRESRGGDSGSAETKLQRLVQLPKPFDLSEKCTFEHKKVGWTIPNCSVAPSRYFAAIANALG